MHPSIALRLQFALALAAGLFVSCCGAMAADSPTMVQINGVSVTAEDLQWDFFSNQLPPTADRLDHKKLLNKVIDRYLIRTRLKSIPIEIPDEVLQQEVDSLLKLSAKKGETPAEVLAKLKLTQEGLRDILWTDAAWKVYASSIVTFSHLVAEWELRQYEYNGTRVKASQILLRLPVNASAEKWEEATIKLWQLREQIVNKEISFEEAAKKYSESPSGKNGGDMGEFEYRGRVDEAISSVAFRVETGEISEPVRSPFGVHLIWVRERIPGLYSLDDARPEIMSILSKRLWDETVLNEREKANIVPVTP